MDENPFLQLGIISKRELALLHVKPLGLEFWLG